MKSQGADCLQRGFWPAIQELMYPRHLRTMGAAETGQQRTRLTRTLVITRQQ